MCKKTAFLLSFVMLLALAGNVQAIDIVWTDTTEDHSWFTAANWEPSGPPTLNDLALINLLPGPTIASEGAVAYVVYPGYDGGTGAMTMDGGTLMTSPWGIAVGEGGAGTVGTFNMNSGTITTPDFMLGYGGTGTLNMTGGTITIVEWGLYVGGDGTGIGYVNLDGGTITTVDLIFGYNGGSGTIDITAGTLIIDGDVVSTVQGYIDSGWITAYGGSGTVLYDYADGKTTLWSIAVIVIITESDGSTQVAESGITDSYEVVLTEQPSSEVTITATPTDSEIDIGNGAGTAKVLIFTNSNWETPRTVTVSAVDDRLVEGLHSSTITHTAGGDPNYAGIFIADVVVSITDNDWTGDINQDGSIDLGDLLALADKWLDDCFPADWC